MITPETLVFENLSDENLKLRAKNLKLKKLLDEAVALMRAIADPDTKEITFFVPDDALANFEWRENGVVNVLGGYEIKASDVRALTAFIVRLEKISK